MLHNQYFIVYVDDPDSPSGIGISGIFDNRDYATQWAMSEGPDYKVETMPFGPIDWSKLNPLPPFDWSL